MSIGDTVTVTVFGGEYRGARTRHGKVLEVYDHFVLVQCKHYLVCINQSMAHKQLCKADRGGGNYCGR